MKNLEHVQEIVMGVPQRMNLDRYMQWLKEPEQSNNVEGSELEVHAQHLLDKALNNINEVMTEKVDIEVEKIVDKVGDF